MLLGALSRWHLRCGDTASRRLLHRAHRSFPRTLHTNNAFFKVSDEVRAAVESNKPVVALETTIYTHGFPYPDNVALSSHLESTVRLHGGVPATIGVLDGVVHVGLAAEEMVRLLSRSSANHETIKLSRRDMGYICGLGLFGRKINGGTTVAGTMLLAHLAGIKVFATGGLGGVHRGGEVSLDISADLKELGRTPVAVISSGCKSFLDISRTLEYLETEGVGVATFADGREGDIEFPAFWTRDSGVRSPAVIRNEVEAASIIYAQHTLSVSSGLLFANPIPRGSGLAKTDIDDAISQAIEDARRSCVHGKDNTPFVLRRIQELTQGRSVVANRSLVESNVIRGTKVATELAKLYEDRAPSLASVPPGPAAAGNYLSRFSNTASAPPVPPNPTLTYGYQSGLNPNYVSTSTLGVRLDTPSSQVDIVVAGSLAIDLSCDFSPLEGSPTKSTTSPQLQTSNPAIFAQSLGGVGHNVAYCSHLLGVSVRLCSVIAGDIYGTAALDMLRNEGLKDEGIKVLKPGPGSQTAQYVAFNDQNKDLVIAMADMRILEEPGCTLVETWKSTLEVSKPKCLVVDANWDSSMIRHWSSIGKAAGAAVMLEPVSAQKASRLFHKTTADASDLGVFPNHQFDIVTPNAIELGKMFEAAQEGEQLSRSDWWRVINSFGFSSAGTRDRLVALTNESLVGSGIPQQSLQLLPFIPCVLTKLGSRGVLLTQILRHGDYRLMSPAAAPYIVSRIEDERSQAAAVYMRLFPPAEIVRDQDVVSVNGVGDTFLGVLAAGLVRSSGADFDRLIEIAQKASVMTLKTKSAVHPLLGQLSPELEF